MEGRRENTKKESTASKSLRPLVPSALPLFAPFSFPIPNKPYSFGDHVNRLESVIPFSPSSRPQDLYLQHDEKNIVNCIDTNNTVKVEIESTDGRNHLDTNMDPRKLKRIISNRVSAQKSRMKKLQYVTEMERKVKALEAKIAVLYPQVLMYGNKKYMLEMEQKRLGHEISACKSKKLLKDGEIAENRAELDKLRKLYSVEEGEKWEGQNWNNNNVGQPSHRGGGELGENLGSNWTEEVESEDSWIPNFAAALMEDCSSKIMGIDQILKP